MKQAIEPLLVPFGTLCRCLKYSLLLYRILKVTKELMKISSLYHPDKALNIQDYIRRGPQDVIILFFALTPQLIQMIKDW